MKMMRKRLDEIQDILNKGLRDSDKEGITDADIRARINYIRKVGGDEAIQECLRIFKAYKNGEINQEEALKRAGQFDERLEKIEKERAAQTNE